MFNASGMLQCFRIIIANYFKFVTWLSIIKREKV
ncbi:hypothetical protein T10_13126, partial [Trichinella papuae]